MKSTSAVGPAQETRSRAHAVDVRTAPHGERRRDGLTAAALPFEVPLGNFVTPFEVPLKKQLMIFTAALSHICHFLNAII